VTDNDKHLPFKHYIMKKRQIATIILLLFMGVASCKKAENKSAASNPLTGEQVAAIAANALALNTHGLAANLDNIAADAPISINQGCGTTVYDSTISSGNANGINYSYFLKYSHYLFCNQKGLQDNITYNLTYHGSSDGPDITSLDTGTSVFKISGLTPNATNYNINGEYKRSGKFIVIHQTFRGEVSGSSDVDVITNNLQISKSTKMILGGNSLITIRITVPYLGSYQTFVFSAPMAFNGDGTVTLASIFGRSYTINLYTGLISNQ
jgi:hypothetical protein